MSRLHQRTVFITGGSRGIGRAIALACAREGANVVIGAKTDTPHAKLPGTIHTVAEEIRNAGGQALPLVLDVRDERQVRQRMEEAANHFGGIDALGLEQRYQRAVVEPLPETVLVLQRASAEFCHDPLVAREVEQTVYRGVHRHIGAQLDRQHIVEYRAVGVGKHQRGIEPTQ